MKIVSAFRPWPPDAPSHRKLGPFDWIAALRMLAATAEQSCVCQTFALTDVDTSLPVPSIQVETTERLRLMNWILEVSLRYLESPAFDDDTVFVSPDTLVYADLRPYFRSDLTILVRSAPKYHKRPVLNAAQWWPLASRDKLIRFYRMAFDVARQLPEHLQTWGGDCEALRVLLMPISAGQYRRGGLTVWMVESTQVLLSLPISWQWAMDHGDTPHARVPIMDFKGVRRKAYQVRYFEGQGGRLAVSA